MGIAGLLKEKKDFINNKELLRSNYVEIFMERTDLVKGILNKTNSEIYSKVEASLSTCTNSFLDGLYKKLYNSQIPLQLIELTLNFDQKTIDYTVGDRVTHIL